MRLITIIRAKLAIMFLLGFSIGFWAAAEIAVYIVEVNK